MVKSGSLEKYSKDKISKENVGGIIRERKKMTRQQD